jgi:MtN3 and saliva related transmembrane protein
LTVLGLIAGVLTTGCWLPQLVRSWRTRSTNDISWGYLAVLGSGVGLWLVYGLLGRDLAIILANGSGLCAICLLGVFKAMFDEPGRSHGR